MIAITSILTEMLAASPTGGHRATRASSAATLSATTVSTLALAVVGGVFCAAAPASALTTPTLISTVNFTSEWLTSYAIDGTEALITRDRGSIAHYQAAMPAPADASAARTGCPHVDFSVSLRSSWDDPALLWPSQSTVGPPPADGSAVTLPDNTVVFVSTGMLR